jgi:hypothetical protein
VIAAAAVVASKEAIAELTERATKTPSRAKEASA